MQRQRLDQLDSLRGLAALAIVVLHFTSYLFPAIGNLIGHYSPVLRRSYLLVDMFFILSGFVLAMNYMDSFKDALNKKTYIKFMLKRFVRIYPLHLFTLSVLAIAHYYIYPNWPQVVQDDFKVIKNEFSLFTNLFLIHSSGLGDGDCYSCTSWNYPSWSISVEWLTYFLLPFGLVLASKARNLHFIISCILLASVYLFIEIRLNHIDVASYLGWLRCIAGMSFGVWLFQLSSLEVYVKKKHFYICLLGIPLALHVISSDTLVVLFLGILIFMASKIRTATVLDASMLKWLGQRSYSIYLVHVLVQEGLSFCVRNSLGVLPGALTPSYQIALFGIGLIVTIGLAHLTYCFIELKFTSFAKEMARFT